MHVDFYGKMRNGCLLMDRPPPFGSMAVPDDAARYAQFFPDVERLPFPVAYPLAHAIDVNLCPDADNRHDNLIVAFYQALRLATLLQFSDYLECEVDCPDIAPHIRGLRMPHWQEWTNLARALSTFWKGHYSSALPDRPTRFPWLQDAWLEVAGNKREGRWREQLQPLKSLLNLTEAPTSVNDALQKVRNNVHHRKLTVNDRAAASRQKALDVLLPLVCDACTLLFPHEKLSLMRKANGESGMCLRLVGIRADRRFDEEPCRPEWEAGFARADVIAVTQLANGEGVLPLYPLVVPLDCAKFESDAGVFESEPAAFLAQAKEKELILVGVEDWKQYPSLAGPFQNLIAKKKVALGLSREETKVWTLGPRSSDRARGDLEDLLHTRYFPEIYTRRAGIDDRVEECLGVPRKALLLLGEAGCGKSSLLCRLVDRITSLGTTAAVGKDGLDGMREIGKKERYFDDRDSRHAVLFLCGRSAYSTNDGYNGSVLCEAVLRKGGIKSEAFYSLEEFVSGLDASLSEDSGPDRNVWIVLDGLNEADRFQDLVKELDRFLPCVAKYPWLRIVLSMRTGAYQALQERHIHNAAEGASFFANADHFHSFLDRDSQKSVPYLEVRPFDLTEGAEAHERRKKWFPEKSVEVGWDKLSPSVQELLLNPLHLHLFHEAFCGEAQSPHELDEDSLLEKHLSHLCDSNPGLNNTLEMVGRLMFEKRIPVLPVEDADEWLERWRRKDSLIGQIAKLNPIEELVSASLLLRPSERGLGSERHLSCFQFRHQKRCQHLLLRELRRQIEPSRIPSREKIREWCDRVESPGKNSIFEELLCALQMILKDVVLEGNVPAFLAAVEWKRDDLRSRLLQGALKKANLDAHQDQFVKFLQRLEEEVRERPETAVELMRAMDSPLRSLEKAGHSRPVQLVLNSAYKIFKFLLRQKKSDLLIKSALSDCVASLARLERRSKNTEKAAKLYREAIKLDRSVLKAEPSNIARKSHLARCINRLGKLEKGKGGSHAEQMLKRALYTRLNVAQKSTVFTSLMPQWGGLARSAELLSKFPLVKRLARFFPEGRLAGFLKGRFHSEAEKSALVAQGRTSEDAEEFQELGKIASESGHHKAAGAWFEIAIEISRKLVESAPENLNLKCLLANGLRRQGQLLFQKGQIERARPLFEEADQIHEQLTESAPHRSDWREEANGVKAFLKNLVNYAQERLPGKPTKIKRR
jgi:tetratricopeptide (TPR) repeat protein